MHISVHVTLLCTCVYFNIIVQFQVSIVGTNTRGTITGMNSSTTYECTIYAVTVLDGPASYPVTVITDPGMYVYVLCTCRHVCVNTNIYVYVQYTMFIYIRMHVTHLIL